MVAAFRDNGLGQILDFVPNHMGVGGSDNLWWQDVLEWGPASDYAGWFDIDWDPDPRALRGKLLIPFLGDQYGAVLEAGHLRLRFDPEAGDFAVWAYDTHKLPICPLNYARVLGDVQNRRWSASAMRFPLFRSGNRGSRAVPRICGRNWRSRCGRVRMYDRR